MENSILHNDYIITSYKKQLRKDSNTVGFILLLYFVVMFAVSFATIFLPTFASILNGEITTDTSELAFMSDTTFIMLESGLVSLVSFFGVAIIYSIIAKMNLGETYPTQKLSFKLTSLLVTFGLSIAMIANYVSNMTIGVFDMFGIDANIDIEYPCDNALEVLLFYVTVALLPALVEEFAFRGVLLKIMRKHSDSMAVLVSGVMFGLMHGNFTQIPFALVVGLVLAFITVKTNSLIPAIIIHFLNNGLSVTFSLLYTNTTLSEATIDIINIVLMITISVIGIISFTVLSTKHKGFFKLFGASKPVAFKEKVLTFCKSPTIIIFTVISLVEAITMLGAEV